MAKFREGERVKLPANKEEGWPTEYGKWLGYEKKPEMGIVEVDKKYRSDEYDDGLREVHEDDVQKISKKRRKRKRARRHKKARRHR